MENLRYLLFSQCFLHQLLQPRLYILCNVRFVIGFKDEQSYNAMSANTDKVPYDQLLATATHISTDLEFRLVSDNEMESALGLRNQAGPHERDIYASYINDLFLAELEKRGDKIVFQFSFGAEPPPWETGSRLAQRTISELAEMIGRHPNLRFQCFLASRHANQSL